MAVKLAKLRQGLTLLSPGDQGMVAMLLDAGADPSFTFSEPQQLYLKAMQAIVEAGPQAKPEPTLPGAYGKLLWRFYQAKRYIKHPKLALRGVFDGGDLVIALAGNGSKFPGTVGFSNGAPFGKSEFYGRLLATGEFEANPTPYLTEGKLSALFEFLDGLTVEIGKTARDYTALMGFCMFTDTAPDNDDTFAWENGYDRLSGLRWGIVT